MGNEASAEKEEQYIRSVFDVVDRSSSKTSSTSQQSKRENEALNNQDPVLYDSPAKKRFDLSPKNLNIAVYCRSLINAHFNGQISTSESASSIAPPTVVQNDASLAEAMAGIDELLRTVDNDFSGYEEEFGYYLQECVEARFPSTGSDTLLRRKFLQDARQFVRIYKNRERVSEKLTHLDYWASRQQLLSGKVVADWIDPDYGPLDPVFGCFLNPTVGRTGPGDSGWVHKLLFDDSGPMAYHSAVHDAFGYLITFHNVGPGYDYLGAWSLFESHTCLSGQLSGFKFWKQVLKEEHNFSIKIL